MKPTQKHLLCRGLCAFLLLALLGACSSGDPTPSVVPTVTSTTLPTWTATPVVTQTPLALTPTPAPSAVGDIGWRQVKGVVYEGEATPGRELAGVRVECSQFSYFPREGSCAPYQITTGSDGAFAFDLFVHDTDGIRVMAEKPGYEPAEGKIGGFDCVGACPFISLVLTPSVSLTHTLELVGDIYIVDREGDLLLLRYFSS